MTMSQATGTDWTRILSDPDLVRHVAKLLQAYREAAPEKRESALIEAMRQIKAEANADKTDSNANPAQKIEPPHPVPAPSTPPFEPDLFKPNWSSDRRKHP